MVNFSRDTDWYEGKKDSNLKLRVDRIGIFRA
jgi:hypothetical protein